MASWAPAEAYGKAEGSGGRSACVPQPRSDEARAAADRAAQARGDRAKGGKRRIRKSRSLLRDIKFAFIAKHSGVCPTGWLCEALGVSRTGFDAWLARRAVTAGAMRYWALTFGAGPETDRAAES
jgi:hypothetical protein